jgi:hypothetical protein
VNYRMLNQLASLAPFGGLALSTAFLIYTLIG